MKNFKSRKIKFLTDKLSEIFCCLSDSFKNIGCNSNAGLDKINDLLNGCMKKICLFNRIVQFYKVLTKTSGQT